MTTRTKALIAAASVAALVFTGSAAGALSPDPVDGLRMGVRTLPRAGLPFTSAPTAARQATADPFASLGAGGFGAYATGTAYHTDAELSGKKVAAAVDLATSDAVYTSTALAPLIDELGRPVSPQLTAGSSFARGHAVSINPPEALGPDIASELPKPVEAKAPPSGTPVKKETELDLPALKVNALQAEASARAVSTGCVIGSDLARGAGAGIDTDIADLDPKSDSKKPLLSLSADEPPRAVTQSVSRARLVPIPNSAGRFGVAAETRQTVAPITFTLPGDEKNPLTIELAGEWVLRAGSDGTKGTVSFGPEGSHNELPMLRLIRGHEVVDEVGLREPGSPTGLYVDGRPVGEVRIGEAPRALGGRPTSPPAQTATKVTAAVDVVSVRLFDPPAELRVGHMEIGVAVPAGGVQCPGIGLAKVSEPPSVRPGDRFSWNLTVSNPNDCVLDKVTVVDVPSSTPVAFHFTTTIPKASAVKGGGLSFEGIGPIPTGSTKTVRIDADVDQGSAPGTITNRATASGTCGAAPVTGAAAADTTVERPSAPSVIVAPAPLPPPVTSSASGSRTAAGGSAAPSARSAPATPRAATKVRSQARSSGLLATTGMPAGAGVVIGMSLLGGGALLRRRRRRSPAAY